MSFNKMIIQNSVLALCVCSSIFAAPFTAYAASKPNMTSPNQDINKIAAVVDSEVVSMSEFNDRLGLLAFAAGLPKNEDTKQILKVEVLRSLIDEKLQKAEAKDKKVSVTPEDIKRGVSMIGEQNGMSYEQMKSFFASKGINLKTIEQQVEAQMVWQKLVEQTAQGSIEVTPDEVNELFEQMKANAGKPEYLVASIYLPVERFEKEEEVKSLAHELYKQISRGTSFTAVARQFSQSPHAKQGGDMGWIQKSQVSKELQQALDSMIPGQLSKPIRDSSGYHLLLFRSQRRALEGDKSGLSASIKQLFIGYPPTLTQAEHDQIYAKAVEITKNVRGCDAFQSVINKNPSALSGDMGRMKLKDMPEQLFQLISSIDIGKPGPVMENENGLTIMMVCDRDQPEIQLPEESDIQNYLFMQRMDLFQNKYMRDVRNEAFVEIRI